MSVSSLTLIILFAVSCRSVGATCLSLPQKVRGICPFHNSTSDHFQHIEEVNVLNHFVPLFYSGCSPFARIFVCSSLFPFCSPQLQAILLPCQHLCLSVHAACHPFFVAHHQPWPKILNCTAFPSPPSLRLQPSSSVIHSLSASNLPSTQSPFFISSSPSSSLNFTIYKSRAPSTSVFPSASSVSPTANSHSTTNTSSPSSSPNRTDASHSTPSTSLSLSSSRTLIIGFYAELHRKGVYEILDHKYLIRGHTFLESDTDFSQIEKRKKSATVYLPEDWFRVVREANQSKPFVVTEMEKSDFRDWKSYIEARHNSISKDTDGNRVRMRDIHWLNFGWGEDVDPRTGEKKMTYHPDEVWVRYGFSKDEPWKKVRIMRNPGLPTSTPDLLYEAALPVASAKLKDLKETALKFVPEPRRQFYLNMKDGSDLLPVDVEGEVASKD